jgi:hypothetical protein
MGSCHSGTHVDAILHFIAGSPPIGQLQIDRFILPARASKSEMGKRYGRRSWGASTLVAEKQSFSKREAPSIDSWQVVHSVRTMYTSPWMPRSSLVKADVGLVGIYYVSVDRFGEAGGPAAGVPAGEYTLVCPLLEDPRLCSFSGTGGVPRTSGHIHDQ